MLQEITAPRSTYENFALNSQTVTSSNWVWTSDNANITNYVVGAPDGSNTAFTFTGVNGADGILQNSTLR